MNLKSDSVCVDVGANVGEISLAFRFRGAKVHAIEPNSYALRVLRRRARDDAKLIVHPFAAGVSEALVHLFLHERHDENPTKYSTGSSMVASKPNVSARSVEVKSLNLAEFLGGMEKVDFLKIDVEGYEVDLIPHLVAARAFDNVGFVAVETHAKTKWPLMAEKTAKMKASVESGGYAEKFSWDWP